MRFRNARRVSLGSSPPFAIWLVPPFANAASPQLSNQFPLSPWMIWVYQFKSAWTTAHHLDSRSHQRPHLPLNYSLYPQHLWPCNLVDELLDSPLLSRPPGAKKVLRRAILFSTGPDPSSSQSVSHTLAEVEAFTHTVLSCFIVDTILSPFSVWIDWTPS